MLAAAGLYGLDQVYPRLGEDQARWAGSCFLSCFCCLPSAVRLASCLRTAGRERVTVEDPQTNIVLVRLGAGLGTAAGLVARLQVGQEGRTGD